MKIKFLLTLSLAFLAFPTLLFIGLLAPPGTGRRQSGGLCLPAPAGAAAWYLGDGWPAGLAVFVGAALAVGVCGQLAAARRAELNKEKKENDEQRNNNNN